MARTYGDRADNGDRALLLRKKVKFLERENARLRKELNRLYQEFDSDNKGGEDEQEKRKEQGFVVKNQTLIKCDKCDSTDLRAFELKVQGVMKDVYTCNSCGHRKSVKR